MVAHLGLRTHELLEEEIGTLITEILSAWEIAECYGMGANHSQSILTLLQNNDFFKIHELTQWKIEELSFRIKLKIRWERSPSSKKFSSEFSYRLIFSAYSKMSNNLI